MHTKEQLEGMSDLQINKLVAVANGEYQEIPNYGEAVMVGDKYCYYDDARNICECHADYCDNWADMGPIIHSARIGIQSPWTGSNIWRACNRGGDDFVQFESSHENILRAAAIVYILMQGSE